MTRRTPARQGSLLSGTAAAVLGVVLLSSGFGTAARWSDDAPLELQAVATGALDVTLGGPTVTLWRTDLAPGATSTGQTVRTQEDLTGRTTVTALTEGDVLEVTSRATLDVEGPNLTGALTVDPGLPAGSPFAAAVEIGSARPAQPGLGAAASTWTVTSAHDGAVYDVTVHYELRADAAPTAGPVALGPLTVALTQN